MCLAQGHNTVTPMRFESAAPWPWIKRSTTEPLCSLCLVWSAICKAYQQTTLASKALSKCNRDHYLANWLKTYNLEHTNLLQSKLFITSLFITEYSISDIKLLGTDLFPLKFPLFITEYSLNDTDSNFWEQIYRGYLLFWGEYQIYFIECGEKNQYFSRVRSTSENADIFTIRDEIYLVFAEKK